MRGIAVETMVALKTSGTGVSRKIGLIFAAIAALAAVIPFDPTMVDTAAAAPFAMDPASGPAPSAAPQFAVIEDGVVVRSDNAIGSPSHTI